MSCSRDSPLDCCASAILMRSLLHRILPISSPYSTAASIWFELELAATSVERPIAHRHASSSESGVVKSTVRSARCIEKLRHGGGMCGSRGLLTTALPPAAAGAAQGHDNHKAEAPGKGEDGVDVEGRVLAEPRRAHRPCRPLASVGRRLALVDPSDDCNPSAKPRAELLI